ncbi:hypothetical protein F5878DRAFT_637248 [Lentinula raphanica]|uniref:Uncharacterized protein n=1 Tax=Lentinula raphanica TaxID=153919 RepID=A0AA38PL62_9AGAR|nr:hypothetical protein F5878DRAFT_637248 [Lentinula raphanica]
MDWVEVEIHRAVQLPVDEQRDYELDSVERVELGRIEEESPNSEESERERRWLWTPLRESSIFELFRQTRPTSFPESKHFWSVPTAAYPHLKSLDGRFNIVTKRSCIANTKRLRITHLHIILPLDIVLRTLRSIVLRVRRERSGIVRTVANEGQNDEEEPLFRSCLPIHLQFTVPSTSPSTLNSKSSLSISFLHDLSIFRQIKSILNLSTGEGNEGAKSAERGEHGLMFFVFVAGSVLVRLCRLEEGKEVEEKQLDSNPNPNPDSKHSARSTNLAFAA